MSHYEFTLWAAGYLEGEGSFWAASSGRAYRYAAVSATSTDLEPLQRLHAHVGGYLSGVRVHKDKPNAKPYWTWRTRGTKARKLMTEIRPVMSPRRQEQIDRALRDGR